MEEALKILLIDDDEDDYVLTSELLASARGARYDVTWLSRGEDALLALRAGAHDVCLLDYRLPGWTGLEILKEAQAAGCMVPVIMLTGVGDQEIDMAAMRAGAADYLVKGRLEPQLLERTIRYAIGHKRSQLELARKNEQLVRLNEEKNAFLGMAAHDLRNPLSVVLGYSDVLLLPECALNKDVVEMVEKIRSSSEFMLSLINDLLDISIIESGKLSLDRKRTDLVRVLEANVSLNMVLAARKDMTIVLESDPDVPRLDLDARKVEQVLNNLVSNAIHYAPPGTTIRVELRHAAPHVVISVKDEGPGIAPEDVAKLFRPFGRARSMSTGGEISTGLGLAIARRIVEGHGGRLWVESDIGRGSTFFVALPSEGG